MVFGLMPYYYNVQAMIFIWRNRHIPAYYGFGLSVMSLFARGVKPQEYE